MNLQHIEVFSRMPQPEYGVERFTKALKQPTPRHYLPANGGEECMAGGVKLIFLSEEWGHFPETAVESLRRVFAGKEIQETEKGYPITFVRNTSFAHEEYELTVTAESTQITAADGDGLRRGIYALEDKLSEAPGRHAATGQWRAKPFIKHRISRCFFGPTYRPPLCVDELTNDIDYYPEGYLDRLAHEGVNGLWLTMYFKDLPSSLFPENGKDSEKRFAKLRDTVRRCGRYGIKIYVFLSEPKYINYTWKTYSSKDLEAYPELISWEEDGWNMFCTCNETARTYLREGISTIFHNVPELGGAINIMRGEDNACCSGAHLSRGHRPGKTCPVCAAKGEAKEFRELAELYTNAMHTYNPNAEFIGWFYAPVQRDGSAASKRFLEVAQAWPDESTIMFNFESGGKLMQEGKQRIVFDYSLAYVGPSKLFEDVSNVTVKTGAKLQVGCSHEDAAVPFIPVPENLYEKYKFMHEHGVSTVMQCWYFGNYPGLMNQAAGQLSFEPFPENPMEFLTALAKPQWRMDAPVVAKAWHTFSMAYRMFPGNLAFAWYGPLHNSIAWPLYLYPVDQPIAPSWILGQFPQVSGDRIGETLGFHHNLTEARNLCFAMRDRWAEGLSYLNSLTDSYKDDPERLADIRLAQAVGLQMESAANLLQFYWLRENMLYHKQDNLAEMKAIVFDEISNTKRMHALCLVDPRLGYHSEAEGYLFYAEKLEARTKLLEELLEDFETFDLNAPWVDAYTGKCPAGKVAYCHADDETADVQQLENGISWSASRSGDILLITVHGAAGREVSITIEPCRMWSAFYMYVNPDGSTGGLTNAIFREVPAVQVEIDEKDMRIRIPLNTFDGIIWEGFPIRFNLYGDGFAWCDPKHWPNRLMHYTYNPESAGWLFL